MKFFHFINYMTLLVLAFIIKSTAMPFTDVDTYFSTSLNTDEHYSNHPQTNTAIAKDSILNRLRRGYYYIDGVKITPISLKSLNRNSQTIRRRQDNFPNTKDSYAKPKKLFVPNLFG